MVCPSARAKGIFRMNSADMERLKRLLSCMINGWVGNVQHIRIKSQNVSKFVLCRPAGLEVLASSQWGRLKTLLNALRSWMGSLSMDVTSGSIILRPSDRMILHLGNTWGRRDQQFVNHFKGENNKIKVFLLISNHYSRWKTVVPRWAIRRLFRDRRITSRRKSSSSFQSQQGQIWHQGWSAAL